MLAVVVSAVVVSAVVVSAVVVSAVAVASLMIFIFDTTEWSNSWTWQVKFIKGSQFWNEHVPLYLLLLPFHYIQIDLHIHCPMTS